MTATTEEKTGPVYVLRPRNRLDGLGLSELFASTHLIRHLMMRSIRARYRPTMLGYGWILARPALLCLSYWLAVGVLFKVDSHPIPFPLFLFLGVSAYLFFSSGLTDTMGSLRNNVQSMSKVYYPRLAVPLSTMGMNLIDLGASLLVVFALMAGYRVAPPAHVFLFPVFVMAFALITFASGLILAAWAVKVQDVMMILPVLMRVLIYAMPCVYPVFRVPEAFRRYYFLNPFASYLQGMRWSLLGDLPPPAWSVAWAAGWTAAALIFGLLYFSKVERTMVDSL